MPQTDNTIIPASFAQDGLAVLSRSGTPPTRFQVLGERSSGTNLAKRLLNRNTDMKATEVLGWKHGFPHALAVPPDLAVIGLVRNAVDWARSMHSKPWHTTPELQKLPLSEFLRARWETVVDRPRYFPGSAEAGTVGAPLQLDRDPLTGQPFENIFALRRAKLAGLLSYANRGCTFVLLRAETLQEDPVATVEAVSNALALSPRTEPFKPVHKRLGSKFLAAVPERPDTPDALSETDIEFLQGQVDTALESRLGYNYA